jgi:hypothetical protein
MLAFRRLDHVLEVKRQLVIGVTELNEPVTEEVTVVEAWCSVMPLSAEERFAAGARFEDRLFTVRCRWFDGLLPTDLLEIDGERHDIKGWKVFGRNEVLEVKTEVVT